MVMQRYLISFLLSVAFILAGLAQDPVQPKHLVEALKLLRQVELSNTSYRHGACDMAWTGTCVMHADCSGFLNGLFSHCYGYDQQEFKKWFDSRRPTAARYHDTIELENGFTRIKTVENIRPGDILAVKYLQRKDNTGHVMLVARLPQRIKAKKPIVEGTEQWEVTVIDSSQSGHGTTDTRHGKGKEGKDHDGLGQGTLRLYADKQGQILGFSWSTQSVSKFKEPDQEHIVVGRLSKTS
jgi:hypothetical protein